MPIVQSTPRMSASKHCPTMNASNFPCADCERVLCALHEVGADIARSYERRLPSQGLFPHDQVNGEDEAEGEVDHAGCHARDHAEQTGGALACELERALGELLFVQLGGIGKHACDLRKAVGVIDRPCAQVVYGGDGLARNEGRAR